MKIAADPRINSVTRMDDKMPLAMGVPIKPSAEAARSLRVLPASTTNSCAKWAESSTAMPTASARFTREKALSFTSQMGMTPSSSMTTAKMMTQIINAMRMLKVNRNVVSATPRRHMPTTKSVSLTM